MEEDMEANGFKVRDTRKEGRYYVDNEFLNGYAKYVGWQGQCVYGALCRHARDEKCFPSLKHLSDELGISIPSIKRGIGKLKIFNIIKTKMRLKTKLGRGSNMYYLLDRSEWKKKPDHKWSNKRYGSNRAIPVEV
jgi:hypothetical protein